MLPRSFFHPGPGVVVLALFLSSLLGGCVTPGHHEATTTKSSAGVTELAELLGQRLKLAEKVAWVKFREGLPVEDRTREEAFLAAVEAQAAAAGYPQWEARRFFVAQIEASKKEQRRLLRGWDRSQPLPGWGTISLRHDVRPELDRLTPAILASWHAVRTQPRLRSQIYRDLRQQGWSIPVARAAASF